MEDEFRESNAGVFASQAPKGVHEARRWVEDYLQSIYGKWNIEIEILEDGIIEKDYGWIFPYQSKRALATGALRDFLSTAMLLVEKKTGKLVIFTPARTLEQNLKLYESGQLAEHPDWIRRQAEKDGARKQDEEYFAREEAPLLRDLAQAGRSVNSVWDLVNTQEKYPEAIPVLLHHVQRRYHPRVREGIARALSVKYLGADAYPILLEEYKKEAPGIQRIEGVRAAGDTKWGLGMAFANAIRERNIPEVLELVKRKEDGPARGNLVLALAQYNEPRIISALVDLLNDSDVRICSIVALRKLKAKEALPSLQAFVNSEEAILRKESRAAIAKIKAK